jgi:alpha-amylase/alpha-mannosidase (GH57 family)
MPQPSASSDVLPTIKAPISLVVHGHFYQPPRENPWTDEISREPSAAPFHDWNARILAECYRANGFARIHTAGNKVRELVNNYAHISFNVGPTLARFLDRVDATTMVRMREGDTEQAGRLGSGGGMAQVWGHPIAPLLNSRDLRTQTLWGLADFERRFGRKSEGIWLPETAADPATLSSLIDLGIEYTILAPEQIAAVRPPGGAWKPVNRDTVDTGRTYKFVHGDGSGRSLAIAVFDGPLSRELAFGTATRNSESFVAALEASAARSSASNRRLVLAASDGELYGHHKKFADLALAHAVVEGAPKAGIAVTNLGAFLREHPPTWEAELAKGPGGEGTAWSCAHGLGRWQRHCGCAMRSPEESGWSQSWRGPLRAALDHVRDKGSVFFEDAAGELFADPWEVRDEYGRALEASPEERMRFLHRRGRGRLKRLLGSKTGGGDRRALLLLEMQRAAISMYASCGWFFDDVAGIESALVIRQAAYALDLWKELGGKPPVKDFVDRLAEARSNIPQAGTGADVYRRVCQHRTTAGHALAAAALAEVAGAQPSAAPHKDVAGFAIDRSRPKSGAPVVKGKATVRHLRTGATEELHYQAKAQGPLALVAKVGTQSFALAALPEEAREPIALALLSRLAETPVVSAREAQQALELARSAGSAGDRIDPVLVPVFADIIPRMLAAQAAESAGTELLAAVTEVLDAVPEGTRGGPAGAIQEWLWQGLTILRAKGKTPSVAFRMLAEMVGLVVDGGRGK